MSNVIQILDEWPFGNVTFFSPSHWIAEKAIIIVNTNNIVTDISRSVWPSQKNTICLAWDMKLANFARFPTFFSVSQDTQKIRHTYYIHRRFHEYSVFYYIELWMSWFIDKQRFFCESFCLLPRSHRNRNNILRKASLCLANKRHIYSYIYSIIMMMMMMIDDERISKTIYSFLHVCSFIATRKTDTMIPKLNNYYQIYVYAWIW